MRKLAIIILWVITLGGCVAIQPAVDANAPPDTSAAYITGTFTRTKGSGFAFIVRNTETNQEYAMSLGEDSSLPTAVTNQVITIKVPPGKYSVSHWVTYGTLTKERSALRPITNTSLSAPFSIQAGSIIYLGKFDVSSTRSGNGIYYSIKPLPLALSDAEEQFFAAHRKFKSNAFTCLLCLDTLATNVPTMTLKDFPLPTKD